MKTTKSILIVLFNVMLISCETNPTNNEGKINSGITGDWLWKSTSGGFAGTVTTPINGNVHILKITGDSNFIELRNDTTTFTDKFTTRQYAFDSSQSYLLIDFITSKRSNLFVTNVTNDSLVLSDMLMDGYTSIYTKNK